MISDWSQQPDNDALTTAELALKSWSLFAVACWPRCSGDAWLVRSSIKFSATAEMLFCYKGTKNLRVPILGPQLGIPADQVDPKVCVARCMKAYLDRSARLEGRWLLDSVPAGRHSSRLDVARLDTMWCRPCLHRRFNPTSRFLQC